jgi:hypothetical protein
MAESKQDDKKATRRDAQGEEIDMSAHIPEGTEDAMDTDLDPDDRDMSAVTDEPGLHPTSVTFGTVVSDHATDAAGNTPEDIAAQAEERGVKTGRSESSEQDDDTKSGGKSGKSKK